MAKVSAGLVMYRICAGRIEVLLGHPGGPFFARKDEGAWTIPKGEIDKHEDPLSAAVREFHEETGFTPAPPYLDLGTIRQKSGKLVHGWAFEGACDPRASCSNTTQIEWPPRSGRKLEIPELDRVEFFRLKEATRKIRPAQAPLLERLRDMLKAEDS